MRKLYFVCFALILSIAMILPVTLPVGASTNENQPVSWVNSTNNENHQALPAQHGGHVILVKILADGSTVGHVQVYDRVTRMLMVSTGFDQTATIFEKRDGANYAEFVVFLKPSPDNPPGWDFNMTVKYQIWDYNEPGLNDYHIVWAKFGNIWYYFDTIFYDAGEAQVHLGN